MIIFKVILISFIGILISGIFKQFKSEYIILPFILSVVICIIKVMEKSIASFFYEIENISEQINLDDKYLVDIIKLLIISYAGKFGFNICNDFGYKTFGDKIEFCTRLSSALIIFPRLKELYVNIIKLL